MRKRRIEFNVAGPCVPGDHYMLDPLRGIGGELMDLIDQKHYFVIHAARQSGKTTLLKQLVRDLNAGGEYYAQYCSLETVQLLIEPEKGIPAVVKRMASAFEDSGMPDGFAANADYGDAPNVLRKSLITYCNTLSKPLVIFFDEADCLSNGTLITFLRQLRDGYVNRADVPFVHSIALVGMRNIRDYKGRIRPDTATLGSASPFNIVTKAMSLRNFTEAETAALYAQHTAETGQVFEPQAVSYAFEQTQGQPWLVNAIARECVDEITKRDYAVPVTQSMAEQAIRNIILARGTHIDSIFERLKEERVRNVIGPLIVGENTDEESDDYLYTRDLGLIRDDRGKTEPANPIYAELIIRTLTRSVQKSIPEEYAIPSYIKGGKLDIGFLMRDFQEYWRENSEILEADYKKNSYRYNEYATHLVMLAFLQRVVNGGGQVIRELALGKKRADLCVVYGGEKYPIELKIRQSIRNNAKVLDQILGYMDKIGSDIGWLVIFDKDTGKSWDEKIYMKEEMVDGKRVTVAGC
ncbi:MAG: hypothetical protein LBB74_07820 [Chitinispirillales bacterium]|jgi:hypothetical protein|nr:hypothetical protein [Chitinispirillales bacterium]